VASRGISPQALNICEIWWRGPNWLAMDAQHWPTQKDSEIVVASTLIKSEYLQNHLLSKYSSIDKLLRVMAYVLRFITKLRGKSQQPSHLTAEELKLAKIAVIKIQQQLDLGHEVRLLKNKRPLGPKSKLQALSPFLDSDGIFRVGGRLQNAMIPYNVKHPIILDK